MENNLPVWTIEDYNNNFEQMDLCVEDYHEERLFEDENDYFVDLDNYKPYDIPSVVEASSRVKVYIKDRFKLNPERLKERIEEYAYDNFYMEDTDRVCGLDLVDDFCKKFNAQQYWYTSGKQVAWLDLSNDVKEYYLEQYDIPKEKWEETWNEWLQLAKEHDEKIKNLIQK